MGQVRIPALRRGEGALGADAALGKGSGTSPQAPADAQQAGIPQTDSTADHMKAHEARTAGRAVDAGFAGMEPQAQGRQIGDQQLTGTAQGIRWVP
jgi:hypothetical protein